MGTKSNSFLVSVCLGLTLTTVSAEENIAAEYSLGVASSEAIVLSSVEPTRPHPCTRAFIPVQKDPESIAPMAASAGLSSPHCMLKGPVGSAEPFALGIYQPARGRHRVEAFSAAESLGSLLGVGDFEGGGGGGSLPLPPLGLPIPPVGQVWFNWGFPLPFLPCRELRTHQRRWSCHHPLW